MKTDWSKVEDLMERLENEGRKEDSELVDQLYSEIDDTECELSSAMEMLRAHDALLGKLEEIIDDQVKVENDCYGRPSSKLLKDILNAMNEASRDTVYGDVRVLKNATATKVNNYKFND